MEESREVVTRTLGMSGAQRTLATTIVLALATAGCDAWGGDAQQEEPPSLPALELLTTIGCGACDGPEQITPTGLDVDADRVIVFDQHAPLVRTFDLDGGSLAMFGRRGQGPGEIQAPDFVPTFGFAGQHGRTLVYDFVGMHEYDGAGAPLVLHPWALFLPLATFYEATQQRFYVLSLPPPWQGSSGPRVATLVAYDVASEEFGPHVLFDQTAMPQDEDDPDRRIVTTIAAAPDGRILLADRRDYDLYWYTAAGVPGRTFGREVPRPKLTPRRRRQIEAMQSQVGAAEGIDDTMEHFAADGLRFDARGRLWVETLRWSETGDERRSTTFDLFDAADKYLGEVRLDVSLGSSGYPLVTLRGDLLAGAHPGPEGEWRVSVWRIVDR